MIPEAALTGVRIAVTRTEGRGTVLADALRAVGATVTELTLTRIESLDPEPLASALTDIARYDWILLTNVNAVHQVAAACIARGASSAQALRRCKVAVVGATTADAAQTAGWTPTLVPARFLAEGLVDAMAMRDDVDGSRMLYPSAEGARDVLPAGLRALGATVDIIPVYRSATDLEGQARLRRLAHEGALDLITVATPSAVDALLSALPAEYAKRLPLACIGPVTARAARHAGFPVKVESDSATTSVFVKRIVAACALKR